jgi:hypothetical protein
MDKSLYPQRPLENQYLQTPLGKNILKILVASQIHTYLTKGAQFNQVHISACKLSSSYISTKMKIEKQAHVYRARWKFQEIHTS